MFWDSSIFALTEQSLRFPLVNSTRRLEQGGSGFCKKCKYDFESSVGDVSIESVEIRSDSLDTSYDADIISGRCF